MISSVPDKQRISVSLNMDTSGDINPKLNAITENLRHFHALHGKTLTLDLENAWSNPVSALSLQVSTLVPCLVAASDSGILPHYTAAPRGRAWAHRIAASVKQSQQHRHSVAISANQRSGLRIKTTRSEALVLYLRHYSIFESIQRETVLSSISKR